MASNLETISKKFQAHREKTGTSGRSVRYPEDLQKMLFDAKESGSTYSQLQSASGMSLSGLERVINRFRQIESGQVTEPRRPGRPRKEETQATEKRGPGRPKKSEAQPQRPAGAMNKIQGKTTATKATKSSGTSAKAAAPKAKKAPAAAKPKSAMAKKGPGRPAKYVNGHGSEVSAVLTTPAGKTMTLRGSAKDVARIMQEYSNA